MRELLVFDELDFYWDRPAHNRRKIFGSHYTLKVFESLGIDLDEFLEKIAAAMTKNDVHYAYIGKRGSGFYVELHKFSESAIKYCKENYGPLKEA